MPQSKTPKIVWSQLAEVQNNFVYFAKKKDIFSREKSENIHVIHYADTAARVSQNDN